MKNTNLILSKKGIAWATSAYGSKGLVDAADYGVWLVEGEDPNCDMGGYHHNPHIGYFEGHLHDVIDFAVDQRDFFSWGGGGNIRRYEPPKIIKIDAESNAERNRLLKEKAVLEARIKEIEGKLP